MPNDIEHSQPSRIIRRRELERLLGIGHSTIYSRLKPSSRAYDPKMPKPFGIGGGRVGWLEHEVVAYIQLLSHSRGQKAVAIPTLPTPTEMEPQPVETTPRRNKSVSPKKSVVSAARQMPERSRPSREQPAPGSDTYRFLTSIRGVYEWFLRILFSSKAFAGHLANREVGTHTKE